MLDQIETLIRIGRSPTDAGAQVEGMGVDTGLVAKLLDYRLDLARRARKQKFDTEALWDPERVGTAWYTGVNKNDVFWPALESSLLADPRWAPAVPSLVESSHDLVGLLEDPHSQSIATRGLVIGYVQSGKTASFTATIAKAADAGYRMFIVLSGVHNALRRQTQIRLERQLHDLVPTRWVTLTTESQDFGNPVKALALMAGSDLRLLAVVKKNGSRLRRLRDWLKTAADEGGLDTCPVLIIDDEADQASPNAARNADLDRSTINRLIVEIVGLPRVAYVGYTATPFANVLIDPGAPEDLYPSSFIYSLKKPAGYFGAEELFGLGLSEDEVTRSYDMVRIVPDDEAALHRVSPKTDIDASVTKSMRDAVAWFALATAARRFRDGSASHSSMLIHTSQRVAAQFAYLSPVRSFIRELRNSVESGVDEWLKQLWNSETAREPASHHGLKAVSYAELQSELLNVLGDTQVVVDNGSSTDRLLYDDEAATTVIAIGGNTLSRGLTLEGLVSSFFLRGANAYDTLLQMGRWFGYRPSYEDLPRIWTTAELIDSFRHLADVEQEIRSEVALYGVEQTTPLDVAVRIRLHPKMQITNRIRMQYAVEAETSFSGQRPQTIHFLHKDRGVVEGNLAAARKLVSNAAKQGVADRDHLPVVIRDVPVSIVDDFLTEYAFHESTEMQSASLRAYIKKQNSAGQLGLWNVAVVTRAEEVAGTEDVGWYTRVNLIQRSKFKNHSDTETAYIGTLMSKPDRVLDIMDPVEASKKTNSQLVDERTASGRGLLLLYPIAANSTVRATNNTRTALDAVGTLIGVAVAFPRAPKDTGAAARVQVDLSRVRSVLDDIDEGADEDVYSDSEGDRNDVDLDAP